METIKVDVDAKAAMQQIRQAKGSLIVEVDTESFGGEAFAMLAMFNALKSTDAETIVSVRGVAPPFAAMGANRIALEKNSMLYVAPVRMPVLGDQAEFEAATAVLEKCGSAIRAAYQSRASIDWTRFGKMLDDGQEHFIEADEAMSLGLIDEVF